MSLEGPAARTSWLGRLPVVLGVLAALCFLSSALLPVPGGGAVSLSALLPTWPPAPPPSPRPSPPTPPRPPPAPPAPPPIGCVPGPDGNGGVTRPDLQCDRRGGPPCIRWSWFMRDVDMCARNQHDWDWPTWDPYLTRADASIQPIAGLFPHFKGRAVWFVGDSITSLSYTAAVCGMHRAGRALAPSRMDALRRRFGYFKLITTVRDCCEMHGGSDGATVLVRKGWGAWDAGDFALALDHADIMIVAYALHYRNVSEYKDAMIGLFAQLEGWVVSGQAVGKKRVAIFREAPAQHFGKEGAWKPGADKMADCVCEPYDASATENNLIQQQNAVVRWLAGRHKHVHMLPMYNLTAPRHTMHEETFCGYNNAGEHAWPDCCDCTHLCYTPIFWDAFYTPLINILRTALA